MSKNIALCGFMGSGKTTVGKLLASRLNMQFVDTDVLIEEQYGMSVSGIFAQFGEAEFRGAEAETCKTLGNQSGFIIATGGGAVLFPANTSALKANSVLVFLDVIPQTILERLKDDTTRPLLQGDKVKNVTELLAKRLPLYRAAADFTVPADGNAEQVSETILQLLKL